MEVIPVAEYPTYSEEITLENGLYRFLFTYNPRGLHWTMTIKDTNDVVLVAGIKIVLQFELIRRYPDRGLPPGAIVAIPMDDSVTRITRDNLGTDVKLIYITESEYGTIQQGN